MQSFYPFRNWLQNYVSKSLSCKKRYYLGWVSLRELGYVRYVLETS